MLRVLRLRGFLRQRGGKRLFFAAFFADAEHRRQLPARKNIQRDKDERIDRDRNRLPLGRDGHSEEVDLIPERIGDLRNEGRVCNDIARLHIPHQQLKRRIHEREPEERAAERPRNKRADILHPRREHSERHIRADQKAHARGNDGDQAGKRRLRLEERAEEHRHERGIDAHIEQDHDHQQQIDRIVDELAHRRKVDEADDLENKADERRDDKVEQEVSRIENLIKFVEGETKG